MNRTQKLVAALVATAALVISMHSAVSGATVSGVVTNSMGSEVAHASVEAIPTGNGKGGTVGDRPGTWKQTDDHGRFVLTLPPGRYRVSAKDEAGGYPDPVFMLNSDSTANFPEVSVERGDVSDVRVKLGRMGGVLDGKVSDAKTGDPIPHGKVTIRDARNEGAYVDVFADAGGHFQFTVPIKPLVISASADGYATTSTGPAPLILSEGERRNIRLELKHE